MNNKNEKKTHFKKNAILVTCFLMGILAISGCTSPFDCDKIIKEADKNQELLTQAQTKLDAAKAKVKNAQSVFDALDSQRPKG